jgi:hypothetical protein
MARLVNAHDAAEKFVATADTNCRPGGPTHSERIAVTSQAFCLVYAVDRALVGTPDYMGMACWWSDDYKHLLRDAGNARRQRAHRAILAAGLPLDGVSAEHDEIIRRAVRWFSRRKPARATK